MIDYCKCCRETEGETVEAYAYGLCAPCIHALSESADADADEVR